MAARTRQEILPSGKCRDSKACVTALCTSVSKMPTRTLQGRSLPRAQQEATTLDRTATNTCVRHACFKSAEVMADFGLDAGFPLSAVISHLRPYFHKGNGPARPCPVREKYSRHAPQGRFPGEDIFSDRTNCKLSEAGLVHTPYIRMPGKQGS